MQSEQLFATALGVGSPWKARSTNADAWTLTMGADFRTGSRFNRPEAGGEHSVHDTQTNAIGI